MTILPTTPSLRLEGRRALVTGAGRGIGAAAAAALAEAGAHVTLLARSAAELEQQAFAIRDKGGRAEILALDVTEIAPTTAVIGRSGPFDILVNSAGTNRPAPILDVTVSDFDAVMSLNVRAAFFVAQAVARGLVETGRPGSIINISSQMGLVGGARRSVYCSTKWAMEGFSRAMAIDLGQHGIRVNTICPTFVETAMTKPFFEDAAFRASVLSKIKLGRLARVEDIMGAIVFLASDASAMMTGTSVAVDGGWTAE